jgi:eukaryotic-like serine/threonine-protein kinase
MSDSQTLDLLNQVVLGRYRVLRQLAHGGMGAVYLGRTEGAEGFARPVVIKRILPWLTEDKGVAEMFVREARILSNMQHPNIVSVLDFGQKGDGSYLMVLDYVHGYDLSEWQDYEVTERGNIPIDYALHIICKC